MIFTEITPNPASLKFVCGKTLLANGSADFPESASAEDAPVVQKLFNFAFVEGVFISKNFITITKSDSFKWEEVIPVVKDFLKVWMNNDQPMLTGKYLEVAEKVEAETEDNTTVTKIKEIINDHVRPAVAMDGGDIIYQGFDDGVVKLKLQGSCSGCPSSMITLKSGIEGLLTRMIPEVKSVEAV